MFWIVHNWNRISNLVSEYHATEYVRSFPEAIVFEADLVMAHDDRCDPHIEQQGFEYTIALSCDEHDTDVYDLGTVQMITGKLHFSVIKYLVDEHHKKYYTIKEETNG